MSDYVPGCFVNFNVFNNFFVILTFCCAFRDFCGDKNSILELNKSNWQWLKTIEFLSGGKSSAVTVINVATLESNSPIYAWWMALLFAMRLHVKGRFPVIIYKSRKGL